MPGILGLSFLMVRFGVLDAAKTATEALGNGGRRKTIAGN